MGKLHKCPALAISSGTPEAPWPLLGLRWGLLWCVTRLSNSLARGMQRWAVWRLVGCRRSRDYLITLFLPPVSFQSGSA